MFIARFCRKSGPNTVPHLSHNVGAKSPLGANPKRRTRVSQRQCGEQQTRSWQGGTGEDDPEPPLARRGAATASLSVNGIERSRVMSSCQTTGKARPDDRQFGYFPCRKAGPRRPSAILGSRGGRRDGSAACWKRRFSIHFPKSGSVMQRTPPHRFVHRASRSCPNCACRFRPHPRPDGG
jgi:hypothetical protein